MGFNSGFKGLISTTTESVHGIGNEWTDKHVEFHSKNKSEKFVHLVGFIIRYLTRCTVT